VLLELGFISHPSDAARLATRAYQERIADAVAEAVQAWRQETRRARR
jgi:N-acetylmuramoyl-L-alanine amidase